MDALEAIHKRRSVRKFTGDLVPREDLEKIVDAGRLAATGSNRQPWEFIVVTNRGIGGPAHCGWKVDEEGWRNYRRSTRSILALVAGRWLCCD